MTDQQREILNILAEECAEVIQAISKIQRFGLENYKPGKPKTNQEHLEEEVGDLVAMISLLTESCIIREHHIEIYKQQKFQKLKSWSNIYAKNQSQ